MTQVSWKNVDRSVVEKLKVRAQRNNRSLDEEIKAILEEVAAAEVVDEPTIQAMKRIEVQERLTQARAKYMPYLSDDSFVVAPMHGLQPLSQRTDKRNFQDVVEGLRRLRREIGWKDVPIRELIDEGRRF